MNLFSSIKNKIFILDVVSKYVTLKKMGVYYKGCCPFHSERTASFTVSPHKEIFYCFGCQAGGDVIAFMAKIEHCSQLEAAQLLAEQHGIQVVDDPRVKPESHFEEKKKYHKLYGLIAQWAQAELDTSASARDYLQQRGIAKQTRETFEIGLFPSGQASLKRLTQVIQKEHFLFQDLIDTKIVMQGKSGYFSPFEDRILFPIKDHLGNTCGFGARMYLHNDTRAKYINSHEHAFFTKGNLIYGLDKAKKSISQTQTVFLVEGNIDVLMMVQGGYPNTVATLGTACTLEHLKQLSRYATKLYVLYDGDSAGQKAIIRLTELCWQATIDLFVIELPPGEDPASFIQKKGDLAPLVSSAKDIFLFYVEAISSDFTAKSLQERLDIISTLVERISTVENPIKRDLLLSQAAASCSLSVSTLMQQMRSIRSKAPADSGQPEAKRTALDENKITQLEKKLFSAILYSTGAVASEHREFLLTYVPDEMKPLFEILVRAKSENRQYQSPLDIFGDDQKELVSRLLIESESDGQEREFDELILQFYKKQWKNIVYDVKLKIEAEQKKKNYDGVTQLLTFLDTMKKKMITRGIQ